MRDTVPQTTGSALLMLARLVRLVVGIVVTVIVVAILLRVLEANPDNSLVSAVDDVGRALVGPFDGVFDLRNAKTEIAYYFPASEVAPSA